MNHSARAFAITLLVSASAGCGVTRLQTARTVPRGATHVTVASSLVYTGDRGADVGGGIPPIPVDVMVRHGAGERIDWGVRNFFGLGLLADVKWNLLAPERRTALAISGGFGAAADSGAVLHVPLTVTARCVQVFVGRRPGRVICCSAPPPPVVIAKRTLLPFAAGVRNMLNVVPVPKSKTRDQARFSVGFTQTEIV